MGDLRAALAGVESGPLSVPQSPPRAFLFGKVTPLQKGFFIAETAEYAEHY